jgi:hypothetical protein
VDCMDESEICEWNNKKIGWSWQHGLIDKKLSCGWYLITWMKLVKNDEIS